MLDFSHRNAKENIEIQFFFFLLVGEFNDMKRKENEDLLIDLTCIIK